MTVRWLLVALMCAAMLGVFVTTSSGITPALADTGWTGDGMRVCATPGAQSQSTAVADGAGGFYVGWWDTRTGTFDVYLQRLTTAGVPAPGWPSTGLRVRPSANGSEQVSVVSDGAGGVIVGWMDSRADAGLDDIYSQRVSASGVPLWADGGVRVTASNTVYSCYDMAGDGAGGALFSWQDERSVSRIDHADAQRVNASGQLVWAAAGVSASIDTTMDQYCPRIISDGAGGAIVSWQGPLCQHA